jgi:hypothetical protein
VFTRIVFSRFFVVLFVLGFSSAIRAQSPSMPEPKVWAERGDTLWRLVTSRQPLTVPDGAGGRLSVPVVGFVDFQAPLDPRKVEVDAQLSPDFRTASGEVVKDDQRGLVDPLDGLGALQTGGTFLNRPVPLDHNEAGKPIGLKVADEKRANWKPYHRIGVRLPGTPAGRLLFLFEMTDAEGKNPAWYAHEFIAPLPGCPWMPTAEALNGENRKIHLSKLAVFVLEPWQDPSARIPTRLTRGDLKIDLDATAKGMDWEQLKTWMAANLSDDTVSVARPFVIQLPAGVINDADGLGISASKWKGWGKAVASLGEGRKVWLVGHPQTTIPWLQTSDMHHLGFLFCRFTRLADDGVTDEKAAKYGTVISLDGEDLDFRNNWVECPDGVASGAITLRKVTRGTILDNLLATSGAPITTPGSTRVISSIIARNWMERGHDAFQLYGGWTDSIVAYNHAVGASGYANREDDSWHLGANLHSDEFQSQANQTDINPQNLYIFSNFFQFGRHNWPALWQEIGGGTQNFIIDSDAYKNTCIYWNVFQNLAPGGHRGIMTISPDKAWVVADPKNKQRDYIENLAIMGNAILPRMDNYNRPPYGYIRPAATIAGRIGPDYYELLNTENLYALANTDFAPARFKQTVESRPDAAARQGWRSKVPTLSDIYERPILYTGDVKTGYDADFSHTTYAGNKFLNGWVSPTDYAPKADWGRAPDGAARLTPLPELQKIPDMPLKLADFLGDPSRKGGFFDEFSGPPVQARKTVLTTAPWRAGSPDDGFLLHIKFRSVGTPGTWRELLSEKNGNDSYRVVLTKENTVRYELYHEGKLASRVESSDTFKDGDHLTLQVYTPYFPTPPEHYFPYAMLSNVFSQGVRKIRYMSSDHAPADFKPAADELYVWMDTSRLHRFFEWRDQQWQPVLGALDSVHACAIRSFSPQRDKPFNAPESTPSLRRDLYTVEARRWHTLYLDGPGVDSSDVWTSGDLRWVKESTNTGTVLRNDGGKAVGANNAFSVMQMASGRPRCFIRHNIDHSDKLWDWIWTPNVNLPRGEVTLFGSFDGSYETFRVIRGGQGEYGLPANTPAYRALESMASALAFIRPPLDQTGRVPGWGKPDIYLKTP